MATESDNWQNLYTVEQIRWKAFGETIYLVFFLLSGSCFVMLSASILVMVARDNNQFDQNFPPWLYILIVPLVIIAAGLKTSFDSVVVYFNKLYKPPENTKAAKLIARRLFGVPPMPAPLNMIFHYPFVIALNGEIKKDDEYAKWLGGPAILVIMDGTALYLERGNCFSRVVGPGVAFLEKYETIKEAVDLRPQTYKNKVEAWTKDGIKVSFITKIVCRIGDPNQAGSSGKPVPVSIEDDGKVAGENTPIFPCDHLNTRKAIEWIKIKKSENKGLYPSEWLEGAWGKVQGTLANYISKRRIETLFISLEHGGAGQILSSQEREGLRRELNKELLKEAGVTLLDIQIESFTIESLVHKKRIEKWSAELKANADVRVAKMEAEGVKAVEHARAEAQRDLIIQIADGLSSAGPDTFYDSAMLALSGLLEQHLGDPYASAYLNEAVERIQGILKE